MVAAHYNLLSKALGVNHLRLILGTSMGCMHSFVWGETYPDFMDALMPLACQPVQESPAANRIWRKMVMDAIRNDPEWKGGGILRGAATGAAHRPGFSFDRRKRAALYARKPCPRAPPPTNISTTISRRALPGWTPTTSCTR